MHDPNHDPLFKRTAYVPNYLDIDEQHNMLEFTRVGFETVKADRVISAETILSLRGKGERHMGRLIGHLSKAPLDGYCLRLAIHFVIAANPHPYDTYLEFVTLGADCNLPLFKKAAEDHDRCVALLRKLNIHDEAGHADTQAKAASADLPQTRSTSEADTVVGRHARHLRSNS